MLSVRPKVAELTFQLYGRSLHPELFQTHKSHTVQRGGYAAKVDITSAGHVVTWRYAGLTLTEVAASVQHPLPQRRRLLAYKLRGERCDRVECRGGIVYQTSFQLETVPPEVFWTFYESVRGLSDACTAFGVPVISGNVSFSNESFGSPISPTPTVGLVGLLDDVEQRCTLDFKAEGDEIVLLGRTKAELGGSEYLKVVHGSVSGRPPKVDLVDERLLCELLVTAIGTGIVRSAHDCSEGGLAVALAECCLAGGIGARVDAGSTLPGAVALFSESQARAVLTVDAAHFDALKTLAATHGTACVRIGTVGGDRLVIGDHADVSLEEIRAAYEPTLEKLVHGEA